MERMWSSRFNTSMVVVPNHSQTAKASSRIPNPPREGDRDQSDNPSKCLSPGDTEEQPGAQSERAEQGDESSDTFISGVAEIEKNTAMRGSARDDLRLSRLYSIEQLFVPRFDRTNGK